MKIVKFDEYIREMMDTPENYISIALNRLKKKLDKLFQDEVDQDDERVLKPEELEKKDTSKLKLKDLGVRLESSEVSKYARTNDNLTIKFTDDNNTYALIIIINVEEAIPENSEEDFDIDDIKNAYIKFKKYDLDTFEILGQISKNVKVKDIDEEFLINLKIEVDEKFEDSDEEFEIEL